MSTLDWRIENATRIEAELRDARAKLAAVEALRDRWLAAKDTTPGVGIVAWAFGRELETALGGGLDD